MQSSQQVLATASQPLVQVHGREKPVFGDKTEDFEVARREAHRAPFIFVPAESLGSGMLGEHC